jgi:hypothetical protein
MAIEVSSVSLNVDVHQVVLVKLALAAALSEHSSPGDEFLEGFMQLSTRKNDYS